MKDNTANANTVNNLSRTKSNPHFQSVFLGLFQGPNTIIKNECRFSSLYATTCRGFFPFTHFAVSKRIAETLMCEQNIHSPVGVLIIDDQQDLGLAYDRFRRLTAPCLSTFGSHCGRFGVCSGSDILGHLSTLHHAGKGAEEAAGARSGARARARA